MGTYVHASIEFEALLPLLYAYCENDCSIKLLRDWLFKNAPKDFDLRVWLYERIMSRARASRCSTVQCMPDSARRHPEVWVKNALAYKAKCEMNDELVKRIQELEQKLKQEQQAMMEREQKRQLCARRATPPNAYQ